MAPKKIGSLMAAMSGQKLEAAPFSQAYCFRPVFVFFLLNLLQIQKRKKSRTPTKVFSPKRGAIFFYFKKKKRVKGFGIFTSQKKPFN